MAVNPKATVSERIHLLDWFFSPMRCSNGCIDSEGKRENQEAA